MMSSDSGEDIRGQAETAMIVPTIDLSDPEQLRSYTWHEYPSGVSWAPERLEVNGTKGRRVICVLAQDRFHYRIYDLDSYPSLKDANSDGSDEIMF